MRSILIAALAALLLSACRDSQDFDSRGLGPVQRIIFVEAMEWWNVHHSGADFREDHSGPSRAVYGTPQPGKAATYYHFSRPWQNGDKIVFRDTTIGADGFSIKHFCGIARHELGHNRGVYGSFHSTDPSRMGHDDPHRYMHDPAPSCPADEIPWIELLTLFPWPELQERMSDQERSYVYWNYSAFIWYE